MFLSKFFRRRTPAPAPTTSQLAEGERVYAIGDIHGRLDLLNQLLIKIEDDNAARPSANKRLVFLGDLIDRGPDSRGVVERLMALSTEAYSLFIKGNHEELLLKLCAGDKRVSAPFHRVGGRDTLHSYGVPFSEYDACEFDDLPVLAARVVPTAHLDFMERFIPYWQSGDYFFVHAGIQPGIPIEDQDPLDMRWIRHQFTGSDVDHGVIVIHGHTVTPEVDLQLNRIGIDTGAYASGKLTAIGLEGNERWFLST
jgi:serine/threonine protein phosphatase 1